jgi:hypothetical protein
MTFISQFEALKRSGAVITVLVRGVRGGAARVDAGKEPAYASAHTRVPLSAAAQGAGRKIAYAILLLAHASWIVAESPQELHRQFRGLAAESPVFFVRLRAKKMRLKTVAFQ